MRLTSFSKLEFYLLSAWLLRLEFIYCTLWWAWQDSNLRPIDLRPVRVNKQDQTQYNMKGGDKSMETQKLMELFQRLPAESRQGSREEGEG